jgi:hypothetical protein
VFISQTSLGYVVIGFLLAELGQYNLVRIARMAIEQKRLFLFGKFSHNFLAALDSTEQEMAR